MRELIIGVVLLFFSVSIYSQETIKKNKFYIGIEPHLSYRVITENSNKSLDSRDSKTIRVNFKAEYQRQISNKIYVSIGIEYTNRGYRVENPFGEDVINDPLIKNLIHDELVNYLELPLLVGFTFYHDKPIRVGATTGVIGARFLDRSGEIFLNNYEYNINVLRVVLGVFLEMNITEKIDVKLFPNYNRALTKLWKSSWHDQNLENYNKKLFSIGVDLGVSYSF